MVEEGELGLGEDVYGGLVGEAGVYQGEYRQGGGRFIYGDGVLGGRILYQS